MPMPRPLPGLRLPQPALLAGDLEHAAQPPRVDRVLVVGRAVVRVVHALRLQIEHLARAEQVEQELERIASGGVRHLVGEAARREHVEVVG